MSESEELKILTDKEIFKKMEQCEKEIDEALDKYGLSLSAGRDEGGYLSVQLSHVQQRTNGDYSVREREMTE